MPRSTSFHIHDILQLDSKPSQEETEVQGRVMIFLSESQQIFSRKNICIFDKSSVFIEITNKLKIASIVESVFKGVGFWKFWLQVVPRCYRPRTMFRRHTNSSSSTRRPCCSPRYTRIWTEARYHLHRQFYWDGQPVQRYPPRCLSLWKRWTVSNKLFMNFLEHA